MRGRKEVGLEKIDGQMDGWMGEWLVGKKKQRKQ